MKSGLSFLLGIVIGVLFKPIIVRGAWAVVEYARHELNHITAMWR